MYRSDPIPHTGKSKRIWPYMRYPHCIGLYRDREAYPEFHRARFVPNSYDDFVVATVMIRNWKRTKKRKQWE